MATRPPLPRPHRAMILTLAFMAATLAGCGTGTPKPAPTVAVSGKVTYKGQTLTRGAITFEPDDAGRTAHGEIGPDGRYTLSTFREGDGAMPGLFRVGIAQGAAGKVAVPSRYASPTGSKLQVEVAEGKAEYNLDLN